MGAQELLIVVAMLATYVAPTVIAIGRNHRHATLATVLHLLLGWTAIAWLLLLGWSLASKKWIHHTPEAATQVYVSAATAG